MKSFFHRCIRTRAVWLCLAILLPVLSAGCAQESVSRHVDILISGDIRLEAVTGFQTGMAELGYTEGENIIFHVHNASGDRTRLQEMAVAVVESKPSVAVAGGGIEADALMAASAGTNLPVVFLGVSSAVDRGLAASMRSSGNNLTGIETNDTELTAKRLEWVRRIMPEARRVLLFNVPSIRPSVESVAVARQAATTLGLELVVVDTETREEMQQAMAAADTDQIDAFLTLPAVPIQQAIRDVIYPVLTPLGIPIFGTNSDDITSGAVLSYASSRHDAGKQAARLVDKILDGALPADLPLETPDHLEFLINGALAEKLGLNIPTDVWNLADQVLQLEIK